MANKPILRTNCSVAYTTPSNTILNLPINCANSNTTEWPWKYFKTSTTGLKPPVTQPEYRTSDSTMDVRESSAFGQAVVRGMFAYIATDPMTLNITMRSYFYLGEAGETAKTIFIAKLYDPAGGTIETYKDLTLDSYSNFTEVNGAILPATVCPKILWVGASIQQGSNTGGPLLDCGASLEVGVFPSLNP